MTAMTVVRAGMLTSVQDLGRWGQQHLGVPVAGPMDWYSHRLANAVLGNPADAAALEITLMGPELVTDTETVCAIAGAEFEALAGERRVRPAEPFVLRAGERLRFGGRLAGTRATLAVSGGFTPPAVLGSRSTSLVSHLGPFGGRALKIGDVLPIAPPAIVVRRYFGRPLLLPLGGARLRVVPGPHETRFTEHARDVFAQSRYIVTPDSNRMGYRLDGPRLEHADAADMLSDATPVGSVQVPPSGCPILLMADRQTTGGYPRIATVITADLPLAGQLAPGDWIEFEPCSRAAAVEALRRREAALRGTAA
ncbi:MAG TPA: biotin-dependent carboxyltransferase family protein [Vicinamibacterales bacterium]|nr:biotin-dependent carboxyltransferase family protein [Vicinamibacterales bacterium]